MTNEEAAEILKKLFPKPQRADGKSTTHLLQVEAICVAIKMLKSQPCEDAISRDEVLKAMAEAWDLNDDYDYRLDVERKLKQLPSVTPKRPHGKWIGEESLDGSIRYMCDNCKEFEYVDYYDFCPNCGADMRGGTG